MKNIIKTVFVDLDDTIWWFSENSKVSLRHIYDTNHLSRWCPDYEVFKQIYLEKNHELWMLYHYGKIEKSYLVNERFRFTLEKIGCTEDCCMLAAKCNEEYLDFLSNQSRIIPGAKELLEYLVARYDVNVLSNGFKNVQHRKLVSGGIDKYIHRLILSDDAGVTKPLPGIFAYALDKCEAQAESTIMIGDNYDADICGAHRAGWKTIYFDWRGDGDNDGAADFTVSKLSEIEGIL